MSEPGNLQGDASGSVRQNITPHRVPPLFCFLAGTRIDTPLGARAVESLRVVDRVRCRFAGVAPIVRIVRQEVDCDGHDDPTEVWPVRVRADAFAPGVPRNDLWLSPDHGVVVDGVLVPVRLLRNGDTIAREPRARATYLHLALEAHDVLLAEGLEAESYFGPGSLGEGETMPDRERDSCLPFACDPARVRPIWERLNARAAGFDPGRAPQGADSVPSRKLASAGWHDATSSGSRV